jgi:hypothetical protein
VRSDPIECCDVFGGGRTIECCDVFGGGRTIECCGVFGAVGELGVDDPGAEDDE